ncbi:kelch-like protein 7 [Arctopsyche grandis]|uniref:kelch-like protein 7 n=1 Tax=Arctopsyche grandis TaxID=121162 RepID=UPI00406D639D
MMDSKIVGDIIEIQSPDYLTSLSKHTLNCAIRHKYTDMHFTANNKTYKCHRLILSASSEYFSDDSKLSQVNQIISAYNDDVIKAVFEYVYTGFIRVNIDDMDDFNELTERLKIGKITEMLASINQTVEVSTCLKVVRLSGNFNPNAYKNALDMVLENFMKLYREHDFYHLTLPVLTYILQSDDLNVSSEEEVFKALKLWIDQNESERRKHSLDLLNCVRLKCLSLDFMTKAVLPYLSWSPECVVIITEAMQAIMNPNIKSKAKHRKSTSALLVVGSWDNASINCMELYDPSTKVWKKSKEFEFNRKNFCTVLMNDSLMIIGGHIGSRSDASDMVNLIDFKTGNMQVLSSLHQARYNAAAVVIHRAAASDVYVIGGTGTKVLGTVERYNSNTKVWKNKVAQLPQRMHAHSAAVLNAKIYVTGGHKRTIGTFNTLIMYNPILNSWVYKARMKSARHAHSSAAIKEKLYVAGGCLEYGKYDTYVSSVESYDPISDIWTEMCFLPSPRTAPAICLYRDKFISIGGSNSYVLLNEVLQYDDENSKWTYLTPLTIPREGSCAFVVPKNVKI